MRVAPSAGTSGAIHPCPPWEHQALVFIALTPMAPRTSPTSLEFGVMHVSSPLAHRGAGAQAHPFPLFYKPAPRSAHPDLSPLMEDEEDTANSMHPAWARNWGLALHTGGPTVTGILFWEMEKPLLMVMHYSSSSRGGEGVEQSLTASPAKQQQQQL